MPETCTSIHGLFCPHVITRKTSDVGLMTPQNGVSEYTGLFRYHITSETSGVGLIVMSMTGVREHTVSFAFTQRGTRYPRKMYCYVHEQKRCFANTRLTARQAKWVQ